MSLIGAPRFRKAGIGVLAPIMLLSGCVSFGGDAPPTMLVLEPAAAVAAGNIKTGDAKDALIIDVPDAPRKLSTNRVAVQVDSSNVAYLKDAVWADKPAILVQQILAETLSARSDRLVLNEADASGRAETTLSGQLLEFGVDAAALEVVVTYDAVLIRRGKPLLQRRFEARKAVAKADARNVGPALNEAANALAGQVADWVVSN